MSFKKNNFLATITYKIRDSRNREPLFKCHAAHLSKYTVYHKCLYK